MDYHLYDPAPLQLFDDSSYYMHQATSTFAQAQQHCQSRNFVTANTNNTSLTQSTPSSLRPSYQSLPQTQNFTTNGNIINNSTSDYNSEGMTSWSGSRITNTIVVNSHNQLKATTRAQKRKSPPVHNNGSVKKMSILDSCNGIDDYMSRVQQQQPNNIWHNNLSSNSTTVPTTGNCNTSSQNPLENVVVENSLNTIDDTGAASNSYSVNEAIISISELGLFKQEVPSPPNNATPTTGSPTNGSPSTVTSPQNEIATANHQQIADESVQNQTSIINQLLNQSAFTNAIDVSLAPPTGGTANTTEDCRFQYVLAAATSIATKINEDTLTYLNQGQSYEIKLKKLGDLSMYRGKMLKTVIRVCFYERRLQYMEREQMALWQQSRPGDRILEVDVPLSYGTVDILQPGQALNVIHFNWDPTKEVGVYIKVNCISTEFTPKKHGGEKGVPFRIQVETYQMQSSNNNNSNSNSTLEQSHFEDTTNAVRLHAAACQVKVFKLKGADRKHKQDREKIMKRSLQEQEKYQSSYECTVLNDIPLDAVVISPPIAPLTSLSIDCEAHKPGTFLHCIDHNDIKTDGTQLRNVQKPSVQQSIPVVPPANSERDTLEQSSKQLLATATPSDTFDWLLTNRFNKFVEIFTSFSGEDMLRMSRDDLVQICGQADGIRLYNVLHLRPLMPKLKIYVRVVTATHLMDDEENRFGAADGIESMSCVYNAIYLSDYSYTELQQKISVLCNWPVGASDGTTQTTSTTTRFSDENEPTCYSFLYLVGPQSIRIQVTDDVVRHLKDESMYTVNVVQEQQRRLILLLKC